MAERLTSLQLDVEYNSDVNLRRLSALQLNVEYTSDAELMRLSNIMLMIEYVEGVAPPSGRVLGPAVQQCG